MDVQLSTRLAMLTVMKQDKEESWQEEFGEGGQLAWAQGSHLYGMGARQEESCADDFRMLNAIYTADTNQFSMNVCTAFRQSSG